MELLNSAAMLAPIIMVGSVVLMITSLPTTDNNKKKNKYFFIGASIISIYMFTLMGILVPYAALTSIFKGYTGIIGIIAVIFSAWLIISLIIKFKNRLIILKNNEKEIYIRDVEVEYSPAVVSYLMNNKTETQKDLSATILNLCASNVITIEKNQNEGFKIIDLQNEKQVQKLTEDEKYAYQMLTTEVTKSKILKWKNKVKEEYDRYKFSKPHKRNLSEYLMSLYLVFFILIVLGLTIFEGSNIITNIFSYLLPIIFFAAWEIAIFSVIKSIVTNKGKTEFVDTYTRKGAIEYNRWKKFEKFIEDYTLIKDKNYENVIILGKYLSYSIALGINKKCDEELYKEIDTKFSFDLNDFSDFWGED